MNLNFVELFKVKEEKKEDKITPYTNPFFKNCFEMASIWIYGPKHWSGSCSISSKIEFKNGDSKGEHHFEAETLEELLNKMKAFMENLEEIKEEVKEE